MRVTADRTVRIREFAEMSGVTVRALHHYDRLGLLKPKRTRAGYRAYSMCDLETLEQIVALKFIGVPLKTIPSLLRSGGPTLAAALRAQRVTLEEKKQLLEQAIEALNAVEAQLRAGKTADASLFRRIIEVIEMQDNVDEWRKKYDSLVQAKMERLKALRRRTGRSSRKHGMHSSPTSNRRWMKTPRARTRSRSLAAGSRCSSA